MTNIYKDAKEFAITSIKPYAKDADDKFQKNLVVKV